MGQVDWDDLQNNDFADVSDFMDIVDTIKNEINGSLDNTNIATAADIDPAKIANGGAVTNDEVTETGEVEKIPKIDTNGDLTISGKLVFQVGDY